jgi:hypothetical protein
LVLGKGRLKIKTLETDPFLFFVDLSSITDVLEVTFFSLVGSQIGRAKK